MLNVTPIGVGTACIGTGKNPVAEPSIPFVGDAETPVRPATLSAHPLGGTNRYRRQSARSSRIFANRTGGGKLTSPGAAFGARLKSISLIRTVSLDEASAPRAMETCKPVVIDALSATAIEHSVVPACAGTTSCLSHITRLTIAPGQHNGEYHEHYRDGNDDHNAVERHRLSPCLMERLLNQ